MKKDSVIGAVSRNTEGTNWISGAAPLQESFLMNGFRNVWGLF